MKYVLDSSVGVKWALIEQDTDKARQLRNDYGNGVHELISPDIFPIETAHSLTRAERQRRIAVSQAAVLWIDIMRAAPMLHPHAPLIPRAIAISSQMRIGVYDCVYVALAEQEGCELVTADDLLIRNLLFTFPFIRALASFP
jgi:predicted nucleic acid-binding protein